MTFAEVRGLELFEGVPDERLSALVDASTEVHFENGDILWIEGQPGVFWWVLLEGRLDVVRHIGRETAVMGRFTRPGQWGGGWAAFDPNGVYMVTAVATTDGRALRVPVATLRAVVDEVPLMRHLIDGLFHTAREIESATRRREALVALGTLSAGLAHELNNPTAAAVRAVESLRNSMRDMTAALRALARQGTTPEQYIELDALLEQARPAQAASDPIAASDREEALSNWMADHGVDRDWELAPALAAASLEPAWCDRLLDAAGEEALQPALEWAAAALASAQLLDEMKDSTQRVSALIDAVKSYSQMDRGSFQHFDVTEGLESTLVILAHRLTSGVEIVREYAESVPPIDGYAGELNQVWTHLIENAADAMLGSGVLTLTTGTDGDSVVVAITDTGDGLAPEVLERAFDTFFTTKDVGKGSGLGLSIARRVVVEHHGGDISVESRPGRTVFRVSLPVHQRS